MANKSKKSAPRNVFVRTVTNHYTGEILEETETEMVLIKAAWIAESGRFGDAMRTGVFGEIEPYPEDFEIVLNKGSFVDCVRNWPHPIPREQK